MTELDLFYKLNAELNENEYEIIMNEPNWDVLYIPEFTSGDGFDLNHKTYYEPFLKNFEFGTARKGFLHEIIND